MATIGIDIGSGSVRLCYNDVGALPEVFESWSSPIAIRHNGNYITQSTGEIWNSILKLLQKVKYSNVVGICITATCSMVVTERDNNGRLRGVSLGSETIGGFSDSDDVLMWMDKRSGAEADDMSSKLEESLKREWRIGDKAVPELGLPKLRWLSENSRGRELICFELHDWFTYLLLTNGEVVDHAKSVSPFAEESYAFDCSIKGWSRSKLASYGIAANISVGHSGINLPANCSLPPAGAVLGELHPDLVGTLSEGSIKVANGCIDCYAGWFATIVDSQDLFSSNPTTANLSMVAGTSTCFLLSAYGPSHPPIPGIWGPFNQFTANSSLGLYEFGQPATGKLFERLFLNFRAITHDPEGLRPNIFQELEAKTQALEQQQGKSIQELVRYYFYYGDVFGNRSPYNDFAMGEMTIDGGNASDWANLHHPDEMASAETRLLIQYHLTLEFLCFQTKQLVERVRGSGLAITGMVVCGSQSKNARLLQLLANVTGMEICRINDRNDEFRVVKGASIIAAVGHSVESAGGATYEDIVQSTLDRYAPRDVHTMVPQRRHQRLLAAKYSVFEDMAAQQIRYRAIVDGGHGG